MALPNQKRSTSDQRIRASLRCSAQKNKNLTLCPQCKKSIPSHRVCPACGYYKGRAVLVKEDVKKSK